MEGDLAGAYDAGNLSYIINGAGRGAGAYQCSWSGMTHQVAVPVHISGEAVGVKAHGGILEHLVREIKVRCLPGDIPQAISIDVTNLDIGASVFVKDLPVPQGVDLITGTGQVVLNVVAPKAEEEAAPAAEALAPAAPEVIAKGKKEEEGAAPAAGGKEGAPAAPAKAEAPSKKG
jgi:large subunit ribosomal protein L25